MHILVIFWNLEHKRWYQNQKSDIWHPSASLCVDQMTYKDIKLKFPNVLCIRIGKKTTENILKFSRKQSVKIENICYFEISYTGFPLSKDKRKGISKKNLLYPAPFLYHYDVCDLRILQQFIFFQCSMFEHRFVYLFSRGKSTI